MRLLNAKTGYLEEFLDEDIPAYAILSHTWGPQEVLFHDINSDTEPSHLIGYPKVTGACRLALEYGLDYIWIDTCCINKESSAELSEAINSMFEWYKNSILCFVYLIDVPPSDNIDAPDSAFRRSRWWTRGWTLQELLAPSHHIFFDQNWGHLFDLTMPYHRNSPGHSDRSQLVHDLAGISPSIRPLIEAQVAVKLSWAANRETSRREDRAYCLLGLVGIQMPLLYGEGHNAFKRLLFKIMEESNSHDIFLAGLGASLSQTPSTLVEWGLLASSPAMYHGNYLGLEELEIPGERSAHFTITNAGLLIELPLLTVSDDLSLGILNYRSIRAGARRLALPLSRNGKVWNGYQRLSSHGIVELKRCQEKSIPMKQIYIRMNLTESRVASMESISAPTQRVQWSFQELSELGFEIISVYPANAVHYQAETQVLSFEPMGHTPSAVAILSSPQFTDNIAIWMYSPHSGETRVPERCVFTRTEANSVIEFLLTTTPEPRSIQEPFWMQRSCPHRFLKLHNPNVPQTHISWTSEISLRTDPYYYDESQKMNSSLRIVEIFYRDQNIPEGAIMLHQNDGIIRVRWLSAYSERTKVIGSF